MVLQMVNVTNVFVRETPNIILKYLFKLKSALVNLNDPNHSKLLKIEMVKDRLAWLVLTQYILQIEGTWPDILRYLF